MFCGEAALDQLELTAASPVIAASPPRWGANLAEGTSKPESRVGGTWYTAQSDLTKTRFVRRLLIQAFVVRSDLVDDKISQMNASIAVVVLYSRS